MDDHHWPAGIGTPRMQSALQRRAEDAKAARLDAQFKLLGLLPAAVTYAEQVLAGKVEADPEKTKITLALIDRVLPRLSAVRVDAAQVAGVEEVANGSASMANHYLNILASISSDISAQEEVDRRQALAQPPAAHDGAIEGEVMDPD